jgi:hypothetical protein
MKVSTDVKAGTFQFNGSNLGQIATARLSGTGAAIAMNFAIVNQLNINIDPSINIRVG